MKLPRNSGLKYGARSPCRKGWKNKPSAPGATAATDSISSGGALKMLRIQSNELPQLLVPA